MANVFMVQIIRRLLKIIPKRKGAIRMLTDIEGITHQSDFDEKIYIQTCQALNPQDETATRNLPHVQVVYKTVAIPNYSGNQSVY
jgi:hypothetical protein